MFHGAVDMKPWSLLVLCYKIYGACCYAGYSEPEEVETEKKCLKSHTDKDCEYTHQKRKKGLGYLVEMTVYFSLHFLILP